MTKGDQMRGANVYSSKQVLIKQIKNYKYPELASFQTSLLRILKLTKRCSALFDRERQAYNVGN